MTTRRAFLAAMPLLAAPSVVRASSLMAVRPMAWCVPYVWDGIGLSFGARSLVPMLHSLRTDPLWNAIIRPSPCFESANGGHGGFLYWRWADTPPAPVPA